MPPWTVLGWTLPFPLPLSCSLYAEYRTSVLSEQTHTMKCISYNKFLCVVSYIRILYLWNDKYWKWKLCFCVLWPFLNSGLYCITHFFLLQSLIMHDCEYWNIETCHKWSIVTGPYPLMKPLGGGDKRKFTWKRSCLTSCGNRHFMDCFISQRCLMGHSDHET